MQVCRTGLTSVERVIDFSIFDLGGLPLGQRSPKREVTYFPPRSTILQKFQPDRSNDVRDMRYQIFSVFGVDF